MRRRRRRFVRRVLGGLSDGGLRQRPARLRRGVRSARPRALRRVVPGGAAEHGATPRGAPRATAVRPSGSSSSPIRPSAGAGCRNPPRAAPTETPVATPTAPATAAARSGRACACACRTSRRPTCAPAAIDHVKIKAPLPLAPDDATDAANASALRDALSALGVTVMQGTPCCIRGDPTRSRITARRRSRSSCRTLGGSGAAASVSAPRTSTGPRCPTTTLRLDCFPNTAVCGDGVVETAEDCDDGNTQGCDGCSPTCRPEGCGNGVIDCDEQCDAGVPYPPPTSGCTAACTEIPPCSSHSRGRRTAARLRARMGDRAFGEHRRTRLARRAEEQAGLCRRRPPLRFRSDARPLPPPRLPVPRRRGSSARLRGRRGRGRGDPAAEASPIRARCARGFSPPSRRSPSPWASAKHARRVSTSTCPQAGNGR